MHVGGSGGMHTIFLSALRGHLVASKATVGRSFSDVKLVKMRFLNLYLLGGRGGGKLSP